MKRISPSESPDRRLQYPQIKDDRQVAALCTRGKGKSREVLLITSRDTGRWVLPKGWPVEGCDDPASAAVEAWEEAGVRPKQVRRKPVGSYVYDKRLGNGIAVPVETWVFRIKVAGLAETFPEAAQRNRVWVSPRKAAKMVAEPGLRAILEEL
ncbi:NUDIX hydrolase [Marinovum sp.]|uniref:NUDIX hydrolase n=1 Tax=Marinovum sp. TaxID=2024839 RepID=UPI003A9356BD